jgi:diaminohydroxyphosphoribosylaminopyrimidine deaminase / 5-amino-6-(5-phosphoribosylamino)uracil reductase
VEPATWLRILCGYVEYFSRTTFTIGYGFLPTKNKRGLEMGKTPAQLVTPYTAITSAPSDRPFVVAQLGQSLDGRIATPTGESRWINRHAALTHVHQVRASVDAVMVGIGTVAADDPILNVRHVAGRNPARVVIDPSGRMAAKARCLLGDDGCRRIVIRAQGAKGAGKLPTGVEVIELARDGATLNPRHIVAALFERGIRTTLVEGGAWTVSSFIDAGVVDRLHVLVAPMILGSGKTGLALSPIQRLAEARRPVTNVHVLADGDVLFDCDLRTSRPE